MKITIAQTDIALGEKKRNLDNAKKIVRETSSDLILFPELFTTGFDFDNLKELSEHLPGETTDALGEACGDSMVGGSIVEGNGTSYNTFFLLNSVGVLGTYRKIHLFREENDWFAPGEGAEVIDTKFAKIGLSTCYDIRFPELFRKLVKKGAEIVLAAAEFPEPRSEHWKILLRARAIENQVFIIAANRVGKDDRQSYFGNSLVINPWGEVLLEGSGDEEILSCELDMSLVSKIRNDFPVLSDSKIL